MRFILCFLFLSLRVAAFAQSSELNKGNGLLVHISYGAQLPAGDLSDRFGISTSIGGGLDFITDKNNLLVGIEGSYQFGDNVKEDVLAGLRTPDGFIIGNDRSYADIQLRQRGFYIGGLIGKLFTLSKNNYRSGIRLTLGAGLLQHKIRIQEDPSRFVPQLSDVYKKGYDRLSNGFSLNQFIGYQLLASNKRVNFYAGFEFIQGFTQNRRNFNFDTLSQDTSKRLDLYFGLRLGWTLPFYMGTAANEIYY